MTSLPELGRGVDDDSIPPELQTGPISEDVKANQDYNFMRHRRHRVMIYALDVSPQRTSSLGIYHYTRNLIEAMANEEDPGFDLVILANRFFLESFQGKKWPWWCTVRFVRGTHTAVLGRLFADHFLSRRWAAKLKADLLFFPKGWVPLYPSRRYQIVSTVHDTMFAHYRRNYPGFHSGARLAYWSMLARMGTRRANRILTVSEFSKQQILSFSRLSSDKITVIHEGPGIQLGAWHPETAKSGFLVVGSLLPHKRCRDTILLLDKFLVKSQLSETVRVTGLEQWPTAWGQEPENLRVNFLGRLTESGMQSEYLRARLLVFLSDMEGFGMPLLEALGHGTAICYRADHAAKEIFGEGPGAWDGKEEAGFFRAMQEALTQTGAPAYARFVELSRKMSWVVASREHLEIFAESLGLPTASLGSPAPRKILFAHNSADLYGASRSLVRLCAHLPASRYQCTVLLPEEGPLRQKLEESGASVRVRPQMKVITRSVFHSPRLLLWLAGWIPEAVSFARLLKREKFELLHTNTGVISSTGLAASLARIPHVWHIRDWFQEFGRLWPLYAGYLLRNADQILCVSQSIQNQFPDLPKVKLLHNGFEVENYLPSDGVSRLAARTALGYAPEDLVIGCVGRVKFQRKGQEFLLDAIRRLLDSGIPAKGLITGGNPPGAPEEVSRMRTMARDLGISEHICFTGELEDVEQIYHAMDIFVLPSAQPEPFGGVVLEAMCYAIPVVATRLGGSVEQVAEGETGFLVPPGDGSAIAAACTVLWADPERRTRMGLAGRERVKTHFPLPEHLNAIEEIYQNLLSGPIS